MHMYSKYNNMNGQDAHQLQDNVFTREKAKLGASVVSVIFPKKVKVLQGT